MVPLKAHHDEIYDPKTNMKIVYKVFMTFLHFLDIYMSKEK